MRAGIVFALCAVALTGCGTSEEEKVQQVVRDYNRAYGDADADRACALTADEYWSSQPRACREFIETMGPLGDDDATGRYEVTIDGDTATATGTNLGNFTLRKIDGDWKLTSVY